MQPYFGTLVVEYTDDVVRSLLILREVLQLNTIIIVHHTGQSFFPLHFSFSKRVSLLTQHRLRRHAHNTRRSSGVRRIPTT